MDGNPWSRLVFNPRERPLSSDWNIAQAQIDATIRDTLLRLLSGRTSPSSGALGIRNGFLGDGLKVYAKPAPAMEVEVQAGLGFIDDLASVAVNIGGIVGLDDTSRYVPVLLRNPHTFAVPAAPGDGQARIDIIEVKANRKVGNPSPRDILDPTTGVFGSNLVNKTMKYVIDGEVETLAPGGVATAALVYRQGVAAGAGAEVEPATDAGYEKLAAIRVGAGVTQIEANKIIDRRKLLAPFCGFSGIGGSMRVGALCGADEPFDNGTFHAPPGFELAFVREDPGVTQTMSLYIKAGDGDQWNLTAARVRFNPWNFAEVPFNSGGGAYILLGPRVATLIAGPGLITVDAGYQAKLAGANAHPTMQAAIGQKLIHVGFCFGTMHMTEGNVGILVTGGLLPGLKYGRIECDVDLQRV